MMIERGGCLRRYLWRAPRRRRGSSHIPAAQEQRGKRQECMFRCCLSHCSFVFRNSRGCPRKMLQLHSRKDSNQAQESTGTMAMGRERNGSLASSVQLYSRMMMSCLTILAAGSTAKMKVQLNQAGICIQARLSKCWKLCINNGRTTLALGWKYGELTSQMMRILCTTFTSLHRHHSARITLYHSTHHVCVRSDCVKCMCVFMLQYGQVSD